MKERHLLDDIDRSILARLSVDGRVPMSELADEVGISRATAYKRVDALVEQGVIRGFAALLNEAALGLSVAAFVLATVDQEELPEASDRILSLPNVRYAALVTGDADILIFIRTSDMTELRDVILRDLRSLPFVRSTKTILVLDELVDAAIPPVEQILGPSGAGAVET